MSFSTWSFWFIAFPVFSIMAIYIPIGLIFGLPTYQSIASIFSTDLIETKEFLAQLSWYNFAYMFAMLIGILLYRYVCVKGFLDLYKSRIILCAYVIYAFFNLSAGTYYQEVYNSLSKIDAVKKEVRGYTNQWGHVSTQNKNYDVYVFVVGESVRADYIHAFGYPLENSPFMSAHGLSVSGLLAGGSNTVASLSHMLTKNTDGNPDYNRNIIDLANGAGLSTYWISNQGFISDADTPISMIANRSQHKDFIKYGAFNSENTSDFMLVDRFKKALFNHDEKRKFITVHLYGSHPKPCSRVEDYTSEIKSDDPRLKDVTCYVNSIKKTDEVLQKINDLLQEDFSRNGKTYSMLYFSDHGVVHESSKNKIEFVHGESINSYSVPLFKISSDATQQRFCHSRKSGLSMIDGVANWAGIKNDSLNQHYDLFDCLDDPSASDYLAKLSEKFHGDTPAININKENITPEGEGK